MHVEYPAISVQKMLSFMNDNRLQIIDGIAFRTNFSIMIFFGYFYYLSLWARSAKQPKLKTYIPLPTWCCRKCSLPSPLCYTTPLIAYVLEASRSFRILPETTHNFVGLVVHTFDTLSCRSSFLYRRSR